MKEEFNKYTKKMLSLYASQATVVSLAVPGEKRFDIAKAFVDYLTSQGVKNEVLLMQVQDGGKLIFVVARDAEEKVLNLANVFFNQEERQQLGHTITTRQSFNLLANLANRVLKPFSSARQRMSKVVGDLNK